MAVSRQTGQESPQLNADDPPLAGLHLWKIFWELNTGRTPGQGLPYREIQSYSCLNNLEFSPWELDTLKMMDSTFMQVVGEKQERERRAQKARASSRR